MPGLDSLATYKVKVEGEQVIVMASKAELANQKISPSGKRDPSDGRVFVIVGAGPAGGAAAETLRKHFTGRILLIGKEGPVPYDRAKLSKALSSKAEQLQLRSAEFLKGLEIELLLNTTVRVLFDLYQQQI